MFDDDDDDDYTPDVLYREEITGQNHTSPKPKSLHFTNGKQQWEEVGNGLEHACIHLKVRNFVARKVSILIKARKILITHESTIYIYGASPTLNGF